MEFFETIGQFLWVLLQAVLAIGLIGFVMYFGRRDDEEEEEQEEAAVSAGSIYDVGTIDCLNLPTWESSRENSIRRASFHDE